MYELNKSIQSFAVANDFAVSMNKVCYKLGQALQPFCFFSNEYQKNAGVLDFTVFNGLENPNKTLLQEVSDMRRELYKNSSIFLADTEEINKTLFMDFLLSTSICYIEIPKWTNKGGLSQHTYDKFLATKNPSVMAIWMGCQPAEMQAKYTSRICSTQVDLSSSRVRAVKLVPSTKGNKITLPRDSFSTEKMTCTPLFMLYAFQKGFEDSLKNKILKFTYLKDNNTIRELISTLNHEILMDFYKDNQFVGGVLTSSDIDSQQQGGMRMSSKMNRGYIRIPELGSSIYDSSGGVRSLNLARLLSIQEIQASDVDTSFIHVDLSSCVSNFKDCLDYAVKKFPEQLPLIYTAVTGEQSETNQAPVIVSNLSTFVDSRSAILSTTFHRELHKFMVQNPQWFPLYTGEKNAMASNYSSKSFGVEEMDF